MPLWPWHNAVTVPACPSCLSGLLARPVPAAGHDQGEDGLRPRLAGLHEPVMPQLSYMYRRRLLQCCILQPSLGMSCCGAQSWLVNGVLGRAAFMAGRGPVHHRVLKSAMFTFCRYASSPWRRRFRTGHVYSNSSACCCQFLVCGCCCCTAQSLSPSFPAIVVWADVLADPAKVGTSSVMRPACRRNMARA